MATEAEELETNVEIPEEERAALKKLEEKYGQEFSVIERYVCWESWGKPLPEVLDVSYTLCDSSGIEFKACVKENTDIIIYT
ncbi:MAG: hypothetical protein MJ079_05340 [Ruminococcus sp.]|nr:hypothetical protein [Ruminococcus sp.]